MNFKSLSLVSLLFVSSVSFAQDSLSRYYSAEFTVDKVIPMCPRVPGRISCMSLAGKVILKATLGCGDKLIFSEFETSTEGRPEILAVSVVKSTSRNLRCFGLTEVRKEVQVPNVQNIVVTNMTIENQ